MNSIGMLLQPVMAGLPAGPQTDKENKNTSKAKTKYTHKRCGEERHNTEQKQKEL